MIELPRKDDFDGWVFEGREVVDGPYIRLRHDTYQQPDGGRHTFDVVETKNATAVLTITPEGKLVMVRQFRPGPQRVCYDLPGGFLEEGEDPVETAVRELEEETGYRGDVPELAGTVFSSPYSTCVISVYIIRNAKPVGKTHLDKTEHLSVVLLTKEEVFACIDAGATTQTDTILLAYYHLNKKSPAKQD